MILLLSLNLPSAQLSSVANALIEGLITDLHLSTLRLVAGLRDSYHLSIQAGTQLLIALSINSVAYVLFEIPCNMVMKLTRPRFWLPTLTFTWGVICVLTGITQNFPGFLAARFFIGVADSGFIPGCLFYMSMWYRRDELIYRNSLLISSATLSGAFGGIFVSGCLLPLTVGVTLYPGLRHCQNERCRWFGWMEMDLYHRKVCNPAMETTINFFPFQEGLLTVVVSIVLYFFICDYPETAKFLTPEEKERVLARLKEDGDALRDEKFTWDGMAQAFKDPKVWLYCICLHTITLPSYTLGTFLPLIITELGYTAAQAQLLSTLPALAAFVLTMTTAVFAERTGLRAPFIIACSTLATAGYIILILGTRPEVSFGGAIMAFSGALAAGTTNLGWTTSNISGQTKRATASAMQLSVAYIGSIIGVQLYRLEWAPKFLVSKYLVRLFSYNSFTQTAR